MCLSSDHTGAYVHDLTVVSFSPDSSLIPFQPHTVAPTDVSDTPEDLDLDLDGLAQAHLAPEGRAPEGPSGGKDLPAHTRHPGSVPFVSNRAGAYGRLLLATYVRWQTCDWLRPVTRGGWRTARPIATEVLADVS